MADETHDPGLRSWVESANDDSSDFPLQNLPYGRFRDGGRDWNIGVAIGDQVLDLQRAGLLPSDDFNALLRMPAPERTALRLRISRALRGDGLPRVRDALRPQAKVELGLPFDGGEFTDFYTGIEHASRVGAMWRPDAPLPVHYKWLPIGYHGRRSSIAVAPSRLLRPNGQWLEPGSSAPGFGPTRKLDYELEVGYLVGTGNAPGVPIPVQQADAHLFGLVLLNDWSARDIQAWEAQPLGPFLGKNFHTTVSPWIVTTEALEPFRIPWSRPADDPPVLPYLDDDALRRSGGFDIELEAWLQTAAARAAGSPGECLSRANLGRAYWCAAQLLAHHTVGGCNLAPGDLLGSGTQSAPGDGGSLLELTRDGRHRLQLEHQQTRAWVEDGDLITLRGSCARPGWRRIGWGACSTLVLATGI